MKDLAKQVAELFSPKPRKHNWFKHQPYGVECGKCKVIASVQDPEYKEGLCPVPDPIDITDLGKALECFREVCPDVSHSDLDKYAKPLMHKNWRSATDSKGGQVILTLNWLLFKATAEQLFEICVLAREREV